MTSYLSPTKQRALSRKNNCCGVPRCTRTVHGLSNYCSAHHTALLRYGSPTQTRIFKWELGPYLDGVGRVFRANPDHPALTIIFQELDNLLEQAVVANKDNPYPSTEDWQGKLSAELARLQRAGIKPVDIVTICAAIHFYARLRPNRLEPYSRAFNFALARHTMNLAQRERRGGWTEGKGWVASKSTVHLSSRVLDHFGRHLATTLIALFVTLEPVLDRLHSSPNTPRKTHA